MVATASDLKSAYLHFTRAAVILDETIPLHRDCTEFEETYLLIKEVSTLLTSAYI